MNTLVWIVIFPYMIVISCIPFYIANNFIDTELITDSFILSAFVFILACICCFFCLYFVPKLSKQRFRRVIEENNNIYELSKMSMLIKILQFPAFIIYGFLAVVCWNPFLMVFAIYLMTVLLICIIRSGKIGAKAMLLIQQQLHNRDNNLLKILLYIPILDIVCACIVYRKVQQMQ